MSPPSDGSPDERPARTAPSRRRPRDTVGFVAWSLVVLLVGLGLYYGWRATSNRDRLTDRNLRELDRVARTIEARAESFGDALTSLVGRDVATWRSQGALMPDLQSLSACPGLPGIRIDKSIRICYASGGKSVQGVWALAPLLRTLRTDLFDEVFLADSGRVVLVDSVAGGVRVHEIPPPDSGQVQDPRESTVRPVTIAGRSYELFLQPLRIPSPGAGEAAAGTSTRWVLGGLVSTGRFRAESLAVGPRHLVFLGLLVILTILSLPFLRVTLIGPREHVNVRDVYLLSISLVLMSGLMGLALGDLTCYRRLKEKMDVQLDATAERLDEAFRGEIRSALGELVRRSDDFEQAERDAGAWPNRVASALEERNELFTRDAARRGSGASRAAAAGTAPEPYLGFQMVFWTDSAGMQVAKWTPRRTNTRPVSVGDRPYFTELRRRVGWQLDGADIGLEGPVQYYLQSLRSKTTGEHVVALSLPFCWSSQAWAASPCPGGNEGVGVILTPLASVDQPVLPGGVAFAIVDPEGRTLFHSRPERVLDENFFEETNGNPNLRSLVSARVRDRLDGHYLGRSTRMHVRPITGTPLSLVVVLDDQYLGSVHFQTLALALAMFGAWILVLWGLFVFVEMVTPGRLQWAWPARDQPNRYRTLVMVLGAAVLLLSLQGVLAIWSPVHPSVVLVPVQALALGLLVLTGGRPHPPHLVVPFWRTPSFLGWAGLGVATLLQIALHWDPGWQHLVLLALQLAFVGWGAYRVATLRLPGKAKDPQRTVQRLYVASITLTLAVVGLLPAALFYEDSFAAHLERFVRYQQVQIVDGLRARADRVWTANRTSGLPESYDTLALAGTSDLAFGGFLASTPIPPGAPLPAARPCRWQLGTTLHRLKPIVRTPAFYVTDVAARMANLTRPETDGYAWTCAGDTLQLVARGYTLRSRIPSGLWHPTRWWVLGLLVGVAILLWVPTWLGRRVFLLGLDTPGATVLSDVLEHVSTSGRSLVIVCTRSMDRERLRDILNEKEIGYLDLPELAEDDEDANARALREAAKGAGAICMDHFDQQLDQESWARPLLEHLEHLVFGEGRQVLLLTSREPSGLVPRLGAKGEGGVEDRLRWTRLLGRFVKVRIAAFRLDHEAEPSAVATPPGEPMPERLGAVLRHESRGHPFLRKVADQAAAHTDFEMLTPDALVDQVREMADGYYHALWSILEREEKVVVAQLAESVVVNPKCERAIRRLLEREVLVFDPELRLMNESFARFVREEIPAGRVDTWERDVPASAWQKVRFPILLAVGAVSAFLFATQRGTFDMVIAVLSTATVGTTAAVRIFSLARSGKAGG